MRDFEPRKLLPAALVLISTSCQSEPPPPEVTFTKVEETPIVEPTKALPTPSVFVMQKPFIPRGFDRILSGTQDELYDWIYKKVMVERYEVKLLDFGRDGTSAEVKDMRDRRGVDVYTGPDFGRIGYPTGENLERGTRVHYKRRLQLYIRDRLEEDWIIRQPEINTSSQADRQPFRARAFIPFQKGNFFFVEPQIPFKDPEVFSWFSF